MDFFNPKNFLNYGGIVLVIFGVLGFFLIGPTAEGSIFGETWWFDNVENGAHLIMGVIALLLVFLVKKDTLNKWFTVIIGAITLAAAISGFFVGSSFFGATLQNPLDNVLHLIIGVWALIAVYYKKPEVQMS